MAKPSMDAGIPSVKIGQTLGDRGRLPEKSQGNGAAETVAAKFSLLKNSQISISASNGVLPSGGSSGVSTSLRNASAILVRACSRATTAPQFYNARAETADRWSRAPYCPLERRRHARHQF